MTRIATLTALIIMAVLALASSGPAPGEYTTQMELRESLFAKPAENQTNLLCTISPSILDSIIQSQMSTYHIPGVAALIFKDSNIVWTGSYGYASIERSINVADTTVFLLASISKTFVAAAAMQLWEHGLLDIDADINTYLPFSVINPFYPDSIITMRMLLAHTSSIDRRDHMWTPDVVWGQDSPLPLGPYLEDYLDTSGSNYSIANYLNHPPGTYKRYSNWAYALAGYIVDQISDTSLEQYCQDSIFSSLGMSETSWFLAE